MPLANDVVRWKDRPFRVLGIADDTAALYALDKPRFALERVPMESLNGIEVLEDPFGAFRLSAATGASKAKAEANFALIEPIVKNADILFDDALRRKLLRDRSGGDATVRKKLERLLMTYWQKGQAPNALNPAYRPVKKRSYKVKCGRKSSSGMEPPPLSEELENLFDKICRKHILNENGVSIKRAYSYAAAGYKEAHPDVADEGLPSFNQFYQYYRRAFSSAERTAKRVNARRHNKDIRPLSGTVFDVVDGIGHTWEYDSTDADVNIVAEGDRRKKIGRPRLDVVTDQYSKMIVAVKVTLQSAQYQTAADTLYIAMTDKKAFAAKYGVEIDGDEWPVRGKPLRLMGDNGELSAKQSDVLMLALNIELHFGAPYRADSKGVVERMIGLLQNEMSQATSSSKPSKETLRKAGAEETRHKATLTLKEYGALAVRAALILNRRRLEQLPPDFPEAELPHRPIDVWNWAAAHGRNYLRDLNEGEDLVRLALLPHFEARFSKRGISAEGLYYWNEAAAVHGWLDRGTGAERPKGATLVVDPSDVSQSWLCLNPKNLRDYWPCRLHGRSERFSGKSLFEARRELQLGREKKQQTERTFDVEAGRARKEMLAIADESAKETPQDGRSRSEVLKSIPGNRLEERIREERGEQRTPRMKDNERRKVVDEIDYNYPNDYVPPFRRNDH